MRAPKGRRVALAAAALGAATIAGAGVASREMLLERWELWRLGSSAFSRRLEAAGKLGAMGSRRAIPGILVLLRDSEGRAAKDLQGSPVSAGELVSRAIEGLGPPAVPELDRALKESAGERKGWRRYATRTLGRIGSKEAVAALAALIDDDYLCVRMEALAALRSLGPRAAEAVPALTRALKDPRVDVRGWASQTLKEVLTDPRTLSP